MIKRIATLIAVALLVASPIAAKTFLQGSGGTVVPPPPCNLTGVNLGNSSFPSGSGSGTTIGTVSSTTSGTCAAPTYSIVSTGTDHSGTTCTSTNGTNFQMVGATLETLAAGLSAASYPGVCVQSTISGATGSPLVQAFTLTTTTPGNVALIQTFNSSNGSANVGGATAFESLERPFKAGEAPWVSSFTATLGGTAVRIAVMDRKFDYNCDMRRATVAVDFSGVTKTSGASFVMTQSTVSVSAATITAASWASTNGGTFSVTTSGAHGLTDGGLACIKNLTTTQNDTHLADPNGVQRVTVVDATHFTFPMSQGPATITAGGTVTPDSYDSSTNRTNGELIALTDQHLLQNITTAGPSGQATSGSGNFTANFNNDTTNKWTVLDSNPVARRVEALVHPIDDVAKTISGITCSSSVATYNIAGHGLLKNDQFFAAGNTPSGFNGMWTIASIVDANNVTVAMTCPGGSASVAGTSKAVNRNLIVYKNYLQFQKADGTAGPIKMWGSHPGNVLVHGSGGVNLGNGTMGGYTYDSIIKSGGSEVRRYNQVFTPTAAWGAMPRPADATPDWSANDPHIDVGIGGNGYPDVVATKRVPPYKSVAYTGGSVIPSAAVLTASSNGWTVDHLDPFAASSPYYTQPITVTATAFPSGGPAAATVYWTCTDTVTVWLYDTQAHAIACGSTGRVSNAGGTGTNMKFWAAAGPGSAGPLVQSLTQAGARIDIAIDPEWQEYGMGLNTQTSRQIARVSCYAMPSMVQYALTGDKLDLQGYLSSDLDPPELGTQGGTSWGGWYALSSDISSNSPSHLGGTGTFDYGGSSVSHRNSPCGIYAALEDDPFIRFVIQQNANAPVAADWLSAGDGLLGYYFETPCYWGQEAVRAGAWHWLDMLRGYEYAPTGTPREQYLLNKANVASAGCNAYLASKTGGAASFQTLGITFRTEQGAHGGDRTIEDTGALSFQEYYQWAVTAWGDLQFGSRIYKLHALNLFYAQITAVGFTRSPPGLCPRFQAPYLFDIGRMDKNDAAPGTFIADFSHWTVGNKGVVNFTNGSPTITYDNQGNGNDPDLFRNNGKFVIHNYSMNDNDSGVKPTPGAPYPTNTEWEICNISGQNFTAKSFTGNCTGTPIGNALATVSNVEVGFIPQVCSALSYASPDTYPDYVTAVAAMQATIGIAGASGAYTAGAAGFTGSYVDNLRWGMAPQ